MENKPTISEILPIFLKNKFKELWWLWILIIIQPAAFYWIQPWTITWPEMTSPCSWFMAEVLLVGIGMAICGITYMIVNWIKDNWEQAIIEASEKHGKR